MKKLLSFLVFFSSLLPLTSCSFNLGFDPVRLYKFSASLKYLIDNNVLQEKPEIQLFTSYENMCSYFDKFTYPYGYSSGDREQADKDILENVDFEKFNLLGYMREEGTGSTLHSVSVNENNINIYFYTPEMKSIIFNEINNQIWKQYGRLTVFEYAYAKDRNKPVF